jgi:hypothetical protein
MIKIKRVLPVHDTHNLYSGRRGSLPPLGRLSRLCGIGQTGTSGTSYDSRDLVKVSDVCGDVFADGVFDAIHGHVVPGATNQFSGKAVDPSLIRSKVIDCINDHLRAVSKVQVDIVSVIGDYLIAGHGLLEVVSGVAAYPHSVGSKNIGGFNVFACCNCLFNGWCNCLHFVSSLVSLRHIYYTPLEYIKPPTNQPHYNGYSA